MPESRDCICVLLCALLQGRKFINMHLDKLWLVRAESRPLGLLGDRLHKDCINQLNTVYHDFLEILIMKSFV